MPTHPRSRDVIFLGAGSSRPGGLPAASGLTKHLREARESLSEPSLSAKKLGEIENDIEWLTNVQEVLRPVLRNLNNLNPDNIEDIFQIWSHEAANDEVGLEDAPPQLIAGYQYPRLIRMLALAIAYSPRYPSAHASQQSKVYSWLIEELTSYAESYSEQNRIPTLVTTNYDLLIEYAVYNNSTLDLSYTFSKYRDLTNIFQRDECAPYNLHYLKLHGSISWWGSEPGAKVTKESVRKTITHDSILRAIVERYDSAGRDLEMVPPAVLKDVIYRLTWTDVWDEAHAVFSSCRHLGIIGYSFAQGDTLVHKLLTLGLARSPYLDGSYPR